MRVVCLCVIFDNLLTPLLQISSHFAIVLYTSDTPFSTIERDLRVIFCVFLPILITTIDLFYLMPFCIWNSQNKCKADNQNGALFTDNNGKTINESYFYYQNKFYGVGSSL